MTNSITNHKSELTQSPMTPAEYQTFLRHDFSTFIERSFIELNPTTPFLPNWHIELIASELEACRRGETTRLIINVPPRSLKSHCASIAFPAWLLGHNPSAQIICCSYAQDLSNKLALDCRSLLHSDWYQQLFPTRLSTERQAVPEFHTTQKGVLLATSVGGVLTGRGADFIIIDDPLKPDEALSEAQRTAANEWFDHTLYSRLNDKRTGVIIVIMQRLHEDDLTGHLLAKNASGPDTSRDNMPQSGFERNAWKPLRLPSIAEHDEEHTAQSVLGPRIFTRRAGEALHPDREPIEVLEHLRRSQDEYNFAGQYQQSPSPLGGGMIKQHWFKTYTELPHPFELIFQSWDTANKASELSDYSVCTTWGVKEKKLYLLHVLRRRVEYPELKRAVRAQADHFAANTVLIEDKASGTQLIQELLHEGLHAVTRYTPSMDKLMRLHASSAVIENGFVYLPATADWLAPYLHELTTFPNGKHDDQADSTSQALDWFKQGHTGPGMGFYHFMLQEYETIMARQNLRGPQLTRATTSTHNTWIERP
jgi:predicted phage terminase large subunit-like protein